MFDKVKEWLEKQGYPLEMRVAAAFREAGFDVRQSTYYIDPETSKAREIDVQAVSVTIIGYLDIRFFVECKSGDKPWLLLCSDDTLRGFNRLRAFCGMSEDARKYFATLENWDRLKNTLPWLTKEGVVGAYSMRQAFSGDLDAAYTAAMNVCKACHNHVGNETSRTANLHFAFPVIVVDQPLIRCMLASDGQIELKEVEQGEFLFTGHPLYTCIRVTTLAHLAAFAKEAMGVVRVLQEELQHEDRRLLDNLKGVR